MTQDGRLTELSMKHLEESGEADRMRGAFPSIPVSYGDEQRAKAPRWRVFLAHLWIDIQNALELRVERARDLVQEMRWRRRR